MLLLCWSCKICMAWIGQLMNICTQHSYLSLFSFPPAPLFSPPSPFSSFLLQHLPVTSSCSHTQCGDTHMLMNGVWEWKECAASLLRCSRLILY